MYRYRESESFIVSEKPLNKIGDNKSMAEEAEKRRLAERNPSKQNRSQAQNWIILTIELDRIRHTENACASILEAGAQCINSASWDLYGGCRVIGIPTVNK